jgi:protease PrsW
MWTFLLALALAPGIAIVLFIYFRDNLDPEPISHLAICFMLGVAAAIVAVLFGKLLEPLQLLLNKKNSIADKLFAAFIIAALVEELCKFWFCKWYIHNKKAFNEPLDGIVYMVMVAMGFATIENILYIFYKPEVGVQTGLLRMFLAVPGHACWGVIVGYFLGLSKFRPTNKATYTIMGLSVAILLHGIYDAALFVREADGMANSPYDAVLILGALITVVISYILAFSAIKKHRNLSKILFPEDRNAPAQF